MVDLSIIIISYNTKQLLFDCLESVYAETKDISYEVYVVDNASQDGSPEMVRERFPEVKLMANKANLGFAKANNLALKECGGRYAILLNSDTKVLGNALKEMVDFLDQHEDAGIVGCRLLNPDGSFQRSFKGTNPISLDLKASHITQQAGWVLGAALMIRRETWEAIGPLDENFFFYNEDMEWCYRARKNSWKVWYLADTEIIHYGGQSSGKWNTKLRLEGYRGGYYFCRKYYGLPALVLYKSAAMLELILRIFQWTLVFTLISQKRDQARERIKGYGKIIKLTLGLDN